VKKIYLYTFGNSMTRKQGATMSKRNDYDTSYGLERQLEKSIERVSDNITRQHKLRREIINLRRQRRRMQGVPDEVRQWFADVEAMEEEEEESQ
jgi:hypothetical protein